MHIQIDTDEFEAEVNSYMRQRVDQLVREFIHKDLQGVVTKHLVAMRLTDPDSPELHKTVNEVLSSQIKKIVIDETNSIVSGMVKSLVAAELRNTVSRLSNQTYNIFPG